MRDLNPKGALPLDQYGEETLDGILYPVGPESGQLEQGFRGAGGSSLGNLAVC